MEMVEPNLIKRFEDGLLQHLALHALSKGLRTWTETLFVTNVGNERLNNDNQPARRDTGSCRNCGKVSHYARDCKTARQENIQNSNRGRYQYYQGDRNDNRGRNQGYDNRNRYNDEKH